MITNEMEFIEELIGLQEKLNIESNPFQEILENSKEIENVEMFNNLSLEPQELIPHTLFIQDFSPDWDYTSGGAKVLLK